MSRTPQVTLRARSRDDLDLVFEIVSDLSTWDERTDRPPRPLTREQFDAQQAQSLDSDVAAFTVEADGVAVGIASLFDFDNLARHAEAGSAWRLRLEARASERRPSSNSSTSGSHDATCTASTCRPSPPTSRPFAHTRRPASSSRGISVNTPGFAAATKTSSAWESSAPTARGSASRREPRLGMGGR